MKTSIFTLKATFVLTFLFVCGTSFSQKSVNYESVGTDLEEISEFFEDSFKTIDRISTDVVTELESLVQKQDSELLEKVTDWSEVQLKELDEAAQEAKLWLSKQYFAPVKKSKNADKDLAIKNKDK